MSFEQLFREHYRIVLGFFARRGCSPEESRDLAQDTFLRVYRSFDRFRSESKPLTWVLTIATNVWLNRHRDAVAGKRAGEEVPLTDDRTMHGPGGQQDDQALDSERRGLLKEAIDDLPPQMRRCVRLRVYQDMSYDEIAMLLGISATTAKSQVSRATTRLRSGMANHYPELAADFERAV